MNSKKFFFFLIQFFIYFFLNYFSLFDSFFFFTLSSHNNGKWRTISKGVVSAAIIINSAIPLLSVLVASLAPFLTLNLLKFFKDFSIIFHLNYKIFY
jgi:hypothetical protein